MRYRFRFMARRRLFLALSGAALLVTLVSLAVQGLNFGIDFTGGLLMDLRFDHPAHIADVRAAFARHGAGDVEVQAVGAPATADAYREFYVRTKPIPDTDRSAVYADLRQSVGSFEQVSLDEVQPVIGQELRRTALLAVALATVLMIAYLAVRFELRFAVAAVVALLHDITLTVGLFSLFRLPVDEPFIAAVLTVYGYSMNDTIIVFDRIRERLRQRRKEPLAELIDVSINQVLSRTINTVATVLLALLAVLALGGKTTRDLALALTVGVVFGTYSSIFIASPVYLWLAERRSRPRGVKTEAKPARA
jgi:preprotein translocase subunit SecF